MKKPFLNKYIFLGLFSLFVFGVIRFYYYLTDDFRLSNITYEFPFEVTWQAPILSSEEHKELAHVFDQEFTYLGKGAQCYAFASKDQKYILKFFKFKHLKPNWMVEHIPEISFLKDFKLKNVERKKRKLISVFGGYELAYRENRQNSQLLYIHLLPTQNLHLQAKIIDKVGVTRQLSLDDVIFLIQKKGETLRTHLQHLINHQQMDAVKESLAKIIALYMSEYQVGIYDHDHGVMQNTGFIDQIPFRLDVGKLLKDDRVRQMDIYKKDLKHVMWKMLYWFKKNYPMYQKEINIFLIEEYQKYIGEPIDFSQIEAKEVKKNLF